MQIGEGIRAIKNRHAQRDTLVKQQQAAEERLSCCFKKYEIINTDQELLTLRLRNINTKWLPATSAEEVQRYFPSGANKQGDLKLERIALAALKECEGYGGVYKLGSVQDFVAALTQNKPTNNTVEKEVGSKEWQPTAKEQEELESFLEPQDGLASPFSAQEVFGKSEHSTGQTRIWWYPSSSKRDLFAEIDVLDGVQKLNTLG